MTVKNTCFPCYCCFGPLASSSGEAHFLPGLLTGYSIQGGVHKRGLMGNDITKYSRGVIWPFLVFVFNACSCKQRLLHFMSCQMKSINIPCSILNFLRSVRLAKKRKQISPHQKKKVSLMLPNWVILPLQSVIFLDDSIG